MFFSLLKILPACDLAFLIEPQPGASDKANQIPSSTDSQPNAPPLGLFVGGIEQCYS